MRWTLALLAGVIALTLGFGTAFAVDDMAVAQAPESEVPPDAEAPAEEEAVPLDPILVQGYVKKVDSEQLVLTAPGAPDDLPLKLIEETRVIRGEQDAVLADVEEGALVRAALVPMGEDFVALVVEVMPEEPEATPPDTTAPDTESPGTEQPAAPESDQPTQTL